MIGGSVLVARVDPICTPVVVTSEPRVADGVPTVAGGPLVNGGAVNTGCVRGGRVGRVSDGTPPCP